MKYSRPRLFVNAAVLSPVVCCKLYKLMFLNECLTKLWFSMEKQNGHKIPHPLNPWVLEIICNIFQIYVFC